LSIHWRTSLPALVLLLGCAEPPDRLIERVAPYVSPTLIPLANPDFLARDILCVRVVPCLDTQREFH
jgi:hypothetical protein